MMGDLVRILNNEGIRKFRLYLADLRSGSSSTPPRDILSDAWCSAKLPIDIEIEERILNSRLNAAKYIYETLRPLGHSKIDQNVGLWSWLSLYYFDQVCPLIAGGKRRPGHDSRHILDLDYRRYYRHLLAGPVNTFKLHGDKAPLLLCNPLNRPSKFYEEFSSRQVFITNSGVIEAANLLYYDHQKNIAKRGAAVTTRKAGTVHRFIDVIQQLDLNYDLYSMTGKEVLELLPAEFNKWKGQRPLQ
jgi:hypothetical protein